MVNFKGSTICLLLPIVLIIHQHANIIESASLQQEFEQSVNHFKLNLHKTLEESRIRNRRKHNAYSIHIDGARGEIDPFQTRSAMQLTCFQGLRKKR